MKYALIAVLGMGMIAAAQQPCVGGEHPHNAPDCIPAEKMIQQPAPQISPLKCGKYEHEEHIEGYCHSAVCKGNFACPAIAVCDPPVDRCAPDLHTVTEKEFQDLLARIDALRKWNLSLTQRVANLESGKNK